MTLINYLKLFFIYYFNLPDSNKNIYSTRVSRIFASARRLDHTELRKRCDNFVRR